MTPHELTAAWIAVFAVASIAAVLWFGRGESA